MNRAITTVTVLALALCALPASAHQPRIIKYQATVAVERPEISQAFYAEMATSPTVYTIDSAVPFDLYVNILAPDIPDANKDFKVEITKEKGLLATLYSPPESWTRFYEEFGGDYYWRGPEFQQSVSAGHYEITVTSPSGGGKYSLAIGETESFSPGEMVKTLLALPHMKTWFFGKPAWTALYNKIGLFLGLAVLALIVLTAAAVTVVIVVKRRRENKKTAAP